MNRYFRIFIFVFAGILLSVGIPGNVGHHSNSYSQFQIEKVAIAAPALGFKSRDAAIQTPVTILAGTTIIAAWYPTWAGITLGAHGIAGVADQSGHNQHLFQTDGLNQLSYTVGGPGTTSICGTDSSSQFIAGGKFTLPQPYEVIAVISANSAAPTNNLGIVSFQNTLTPMEESTAGHILTANGTFLTGPAIPSTHTFFYVDIISQGATSSVTINHGSPTTGNAGTTTASNLPLTLGNIQSVSFARAFGGCISDVLVLNAKLSAAQITNLDNNYYKVYWNL